MYKVRKKQTDVISPGAQMKKVSVQSKVYSNINAKVNSGLKQEPNYLVIKELQTHAMPKKEALQVLNEIDIHG